jgi:hypothetical protein
MTVSRPASPLSLDHLGPSTSQFIHKSIYGVGAFCENRFGLGLLIQPITIITMVVWKEDLSPLWRFELIAPAFPSSFSFAPSDCRFCRLSSHLPMAAKLLFRRASEDEKGEARRLPLPPFQEKITSPVLLPET